MRITDAIVQTGAIDQLRKAAGNSKDASRVEGSDKTRKDSVKISGKAQDLSAEGAEKAAVSARADALPETRSDKIAEVKEKIDSGYYNSPEFMDKLADRLINDIWGG